mmetsp:Transcript_68218/g.171915  ORF Transcript_68218/g.171915 Transcript_68218/m.171915 type:complete len:275 (-) Transcript_68218:1773-2597(-)
MRARAPCTTSRLGPAFPCKARTRKKTSMPSSCVLHNSLARRSTVGWLTSSEQPQQAVIVSATSATVSGCGRRRLRFFCRSPIALAASISPLRPGIAGSPKASATAAVRTRGGTGPAGTRTARALRMEASALSALRANDCNTFVSSAMAVVASELAVEHMAVAKSRKRLTPPTAPAAGAAASPSSALSLFTDGDLAAMAAGAATATLEVPACEAKSERPGFGSSFCAERVFSPDKDNPKLAPTEALLASLRARFGCGVEFSEEAGDGSGLLWRSS